MKIGYARKSTHLQDVAHQVDELTKAGCEQIYQDQTSRSGPKRDKKGAPEGTVAKLAMRQPFVLFKGLTFQKLCLPGAFRPGDHHNKMLRPGLCVVHASPQYL
ncbi:recombinase family protein [Klebsiella pneumoniae]|uniref:recombinase family protein n=1 Tax=Klebsiella pneumoniae TaxID=573 RepID=UPI0039710875